MSIAIYPPLRSLMPCLALLVAAALAPLPALAQGKGAKGAARAMIPISDQNLADTSEMPKWTREDVRDYCRGKYGSSEYERKSCMQIYAKEIGHRMIPADLQQLQTIRKRGLVGAVGNPNTGGRNKAGDSANAPQQPEPVQAAPSLGDHYSINDVPPTHR